MPTSSPQAQSESTSVAPPDSSTAARGVLFSAVTPWDASEAVASRIRAAVGLGLLSDGDRLPKEADLSRQLGVTTFALREALSALRDEGLIVTRAGKNGGSFVHSPSGAADLSSSNLTSMSFSGLRDLGEWRQMLSARGASLAAQRASKSQIEEIAVYASIVRSASTAEDVRRAFGRFHWELSAAAQSSRLSRAELRMHEEYDLLLSLVLTEQSDRDQCADGLESIAEAISARAPETARAAAERTLADLTQKLMDYRLQLLASKHAGVPRPTDASDSQSLVAAVNQFAEKILTQIQSLGSASQRELARGASAGVLEDTVARAILSVPSVDTTIDGLGVIAEIGIIPANRHWLSWWKRTHDGRLVRDESHVLDSSRDDFYDYENREFIARPRSTSLPWATGPYVDYGGVDDYVITISIPILDAGRFLGIAGADILLADMERVLAPWLAATNEPVLLLNSESRVIISNTAEYSVGTFVDGLQTVEIGEFGWTLARLGL